VSAAKKLSTALAQEQEHADREKRRSGLIKPPAISGPTPGTAVANA
jgi:hypothetical protein